MDGGCRWPGLGEPQRPRGAVIEIKMTHSFGEIRYIYIATRYKTTSWFRIFYPSRTTSRTAAAKISHPFSRSPCEMFNGGMNLITSYIEVVRISRPLSMHRLATRDARPLGADGLKAGSPDVYAGDANSTANINPVPRTSTIADLTAGSSRRLFNDANSSVDLKDRDVNGTHTCRGRHVPCVNVVQDLFFFKGLSHSHSSRAGDWVTGVCTPL